MDGSAVKLNRKRDRAQLSGPSKHVRKRPTAMRRNHGLFSAPTQEPAVDQLNAHLKGLAMTETKLRDDICRFGRSLFERGLTPGSSGNISLRLDDGGWLVTPTNASLGFLDPVRISRLDAEHRLVSGDPPTKEIPLHSALYETRSGARAIVHLHSTHSVALSMLPEIRYARRGAADDRLFRDARR